MILSVPITASSVPEWIRKAASAINQLISSDPVLKSYTVATLPEGEAGTLIYVTDETGGAVPAFHDGTDWRRVTDRAVVS